MGQNERNGGAQLKFERYDALVRVWRSLLCTGLVIGEKCPRTQNQSMRAAAPAFSSVQNHHSGAGFFI